MSEMTINEFAKKHNACKDSVKWALGNCKSMQEAWDTIRAEDVVWIATRRGVLTDKELRLFACWCVRQVWHLLEDPRSRRAVEVAERYANGEATEEELVAARYAARYADRAAAWAAAWDSACDAAWAAARATAWDEAVDEAWDEASAAQAEYLRENCKPNFEEES